MKNIVIALFVLFPTTLLSQSQFSISLNSGTYFPNSSTFKLGAGGLIKLDYNLTNGFSLYIASGYSVWGYRNSDSYNTRVIPVIAGMKYTLFENSFSPYLSGEFQYMTGKVNRLYEYDPSTGLPLISPIQKIYNISDYGVGLGAGIKLPLNSRLGLDFGSTILLTAKNPEIYHIRTMIGLRYNL